MQSGQDDSNQPPYFILYPPKILLLIKVLNLFIVLSLIAIPVSYWCKYSLPKRDTLHAILDKTPIKTVTTKQPYSLTYGNKLITIKPLADYEIWGLITSLSNDSSILTDHDKEDVNVRDVCLIMGPNLNPAILTNLSTYNDGWTCYISIKPKDQAYTMYHVEGLSNNHLLSANETVRNTINAMRVGDQIYMRGELISYHESGWGGWWRTSSLRNDDVGNGACEVLYVEEAKILVAGNVFWYDLSTAAWCLLSLSLLLRILIFLFV